MLMPETIRVSVPIAQSGRVLQVQSLFDIPASAESVREWKVGLPLSEKPWSIGLIVGPSGSGKSTIARHLWPQMDNVSTWDPDGAIVDSFPHGMPIADITGLLSSVGLGTAPAWLRPHRFLSTGEQFRAGVALALTRDDDPIVIDEFTSVVDRQVGKVASHAIAKAARRRGQRLVAVSCHHDIEEWLNPDWVLRMDVEEFTWRSKRPHPPIELDIAPVSVQAWKYFSRYHYLKAGLPGGMLQCYGGWVGDECVAFAFVGRFPHPKVRDIVRIRRQVVLPDWQGLSIGARMEEWVARKYTAMGNRFRSVAMHPGMIAHYKKSPNWAYVAHHPQKLQVGPRARQASHQLDPRQMGLRTFEWREKK
jgi:energy-coupling factor transporter ATP-binding protein EcfA2